MELRAGQFKAEATEVEAKVEGIDRKVKEVDRSITKIPPDAAKAAAAMKLLGDESGKAGLQLDDLGKRSSSMGLIDERITKTRLELQALGREFDRTGSSSTLMGLFAKGDELKRLGTLRSNLAKALGDGAAQGAQEASSVFGQGFLGGIAKMAGAAWPILAPAGAALAAEIVAAIGGGVLAATGAGAIATAVAMQLKDPAVKAAASDLGHELRSDLQAATGSFAGPLVQGLGILKADWAGPVRELGGAFAHLAPYVEEFATYLGAAGQQFMPGFTHALEESGPVLAMVARELPNIAHAASIFFDEIASGSKGGGEALHTFLRAAEIMFAGLGVFIHDAEVIWDHLIQFVDKEVHFLAKIPGLGKLFGPMADYIDGMAHSMDAGANSSSLFATDAYRAAGGVDALTASTRNLSSAFDAAFGSQMQVDESVLKYKTDLAALKDNLDGHSKSLDDNSVAGRTNRGVVLGMIQDAKAHRDALIAQAGGANASADAIAAADRVYQDDITKLQAMGLSAGLSKDQLDALTGEYDVNIVTRHTEIYASDYQTYRQGERANRYGGIYQHAATGLLNAGIYSTRSPARYAFAEPATGGEGFVPRLGNYARSTAIIDQEARWYGGRFMPGGGGTGGPMSLALDITVRDSDGHIMQTMRKEVRSLGGNVQLAVMGRP